MAGSQILPTSDVASLLPSQLVAHQPTRDQLAPKVNLSRLMKMGFRGKMQRPIRGTTSSGAACSITCCGRIPDVPTPQPSRYSPGSALGCKWPYVMFGCPMQRKDQKAEAFLVGGRSRKALSPDVLGLVVTGPFCGRGRACNLLPLSGCVWLSLAFSGRRLRPSPSCELEVGE